MYLFYTRCLWPKGCNRINISDILGTTVDSVITKKQARHPPVTPAFERMRQAIHFRLTEAI